MKVLFVGDGKHDRQVVPALARKLCPAIADDPATLSWQDISRFSSAAKRGYEGKVTAAILLSERQFGCVGTVCVVDQDGERERLGAVERGRLAGLALVDGNHRAACGVAVESIEAWTLGAPEAIAAELEVPVEQVHGEYPKGVAIEALKESSGKPEHRPKDLLAEVCKLGRRAPDADFRRAVAQRCEVEKLMKRCPEGFAPFAQSVRDAFGE